MAYCLFMFNTFMFNTFIYLFKIRCVLIVRLFPFGPAKQFILLSITNGSFTLPDLDSDSDNKPNGYVALCRKFHTVQNQIQIPKLTGRLHEWDWNSSLLQCN